jgi:LPS export ABC transporter protein LptC
MSRSRITLGLLLIAALAAAAYLTSTRRPQRTAGAAQPLAAAPAYNFEANDVVLRQMGPDGRLQFQIQARRIAQLPQAGAIAVSDVTLHFSPAEDAATAPRWTLTAKSAELPDQGNEVALQGDVLVRGVPAGGKQEAQLRTQHLLYNLETQDLRTNAEVDLTWGRNRLRGKSLTANIKRGTVAIESKVNGRLVP